MISRFYVAERREVTPDFKKFLGTILSSRWVFAEVNALMHPGVIGGRSRGEALDAV
jgi:hypothetical protein